MSAYRNATLTPPVDTTPPWWQRMWFRIDRESACDLWQWARRESGGRWAAVVHSLGGNAFGLLWSPVKACPLLWGHYSPAVNRAWLQVFGFDHSATIDRHRATVDEHGRCTCEVWP